MKPRIRFFPGTLATGFIALLTVFPAWAQTNSHARVVRLSFVEGNVTVERPDVQAWAEAPANTPLEEGFKLSTGEKSFAEIQFENGGTIRLGQFALLDFTQLELAPNGGKIDHVSLHQGYATFHTLPSRLGESLQVETPLGMIAAPGGTEFRVDLDTGLERVEVFAGAVQVQSSLGGMTIEKQSVLVMQPGTSEPTVVSQGIAEDDWDEWVDNRESQAGMPSAGPNPDVAMDDDGEAIYGSADLLQYGSWSDVPGEGFGWSPNVVAGGWAPYSTGQWSWYPGMGYTWIAGEPWGWKPYHYGGWEFIPGRGWVWFPGRPARWSPSQVTWYHGPNWVGWVPQSNLKSGAIACGNNCGGGVVSESTFRRGGVLNSSVMLNFSPTTGEKVKEPGIVPTMAVKLTGPALQRPAAETQGFQGRVAHAPVGPGNPATATTSRGTRRTEAGHPNSEIVFDPQQDLYINSHRATKPQAPPATPAGTNALTTPASKTGLIQPVPVGSRESNGRAADNQGLTPPIPVGSSHAKPAPAAPHSNPARGPAAGSPVEVSHGGSGAASGVRFGSAPAGGGHSAGGGHH